MPEQARSNGISAYACVCPLDKNIKFDIFPVMKSYEVLLLDEAVSFLRKLPAKFRAKAFRGIELLEEFGPNLPMPHAKALKGTDGLRELRIIFSSDIARMFYFHHKERVYVVTSGFVKKSEKTNPRELARAIQLMTSCRKEGLP